MNSKQKYFLYAAVLIVIGVFNLLDGVTLYLELRHKPEQLPVPADTYAPLPEKGEEDANSRT